jgi:hypothetical protein
MAYAIFINGGLKILPVNFLSAAYLYVRKEGVAEINRIPEAQLQ